MSDNSRSIISYFISDLHLSEHAIDSFELFKKFMENCAPKANNLFIMGDLFDYWIGDDDHSKFNDRVIKLIRTTSDNGCKVFFLPGNRDYLIGNVFLAKTKMKLLPDPYLLIFNNQRILLSHGDLLCRKDYLHLIYRKISQSKLGKKYSLNSSIETRRSYANKARMFSRGNKRIKTDPVTINYCEKILQKYNAKVLIHGHIHQPGNYIHEGRHAFKRVVLGDWHSTAKIASLDNFGEIRIIKLEL
jgi:UDP-2,3-diacylglucosamine hydrolase